MTKPQAIEALCKMSLRDCAPMERLLESGYRDYRDSITVEDIYAYLVANPDLVQSWRWDSEAKGHATKGDGWNFEYDERQLVYKRGFTRQVKKFDDPIRACAESVKMEAESIAARVDRLGGERAAKRELQAMKEWLASGRKPSKKWKRRF